MRKLIKYIVLVVVMNSSIFISQFIAADESEIYPAAIINFKGKGAGVKGMGQKIADLLFANLASDENLYIVDREQMDALLAEASLSLSGMVNSQQAIQVGQISGAKILITGTVFEIDNSLMIVVKIIGTETSRVIGASVKSKDSFDLFPLVEALSKTVSGKIASDIKKIVPEKQTRDNLLASLKQVVDKKTKPTVVVKVKEWHIGRSTHDPAAETEIEYFLTALGFPVIDKASDKAAQAQFTIEGEGFSEFASRHNDIVSVKARLELKLINNSTSTIVFSDREVEVEVDLVEQIAGKKALQKAAANIVERLIPKLVEQ